MTSKDLIKIARSAKAHGGYSIRQPKLHVGPIHSSVAGRTDHLPMTVPSGSYVLPADFVSGFSGNTMNGFKVVKHIFGGTPYGGGKLPYGGQGGPYGMSTGGDAEGDDAGVPIIAAGGEYVLTPEEVRWAGDGDLDRGHKVLDDWVVRGRQGNIKTLQKLPPPKTN